MPPESEPHVRVTLLHLHYQVPLPLHLHKAPRSSHEPIQSSAMFECRSVGANKEVTIRNVSYHACPQGAIMHHQCLHVLLGKHWLIPDCLAQVHWYLALHGIGVKPFEAIST